MKKDFTEIIMNPVRLRIVQFLMMNKSGTTKEIAEELTDVPSASLYRHIKILFEGGLIEVIDEKKIRGTIEKTYRLSDNPKGVSQNDEETGKSMVNSMLLSLMASFNKYFKEHKGEIIESMTKDMLSMSTCTLMLTDEEYMKMLKDITEIYQDAINNKAGDGRKPRRMTFISSPCEDGE